MTTGKTIALTRWTFVGKAMSLLFNMLSAAAAAATKSLQLCPTLCDPIDGSPLGSSVPGILQARILEWVAIPLSRGLPNPGIEPVSLALKVDYLLCEPPGKPFIADSTLCMRWPKYWSFSFSITPSKDQCG